MISKKAKMKNFRNILASPFCITWSEQREDELRPICNKLQELLPAAKLERTAWINPYKMNSEQPAKVCSAKKEQNIYRKFLAPGFQSVIRGLEKNELCCVILAGNITVLLQKSVLAYAQSHLIPVSIIPNLKEITKSTLGFATAVLGLKKAVADPENKFFPIYNSVSINPIRFAIKQSYKSDYENTNQTRLPEGQCDITHMKLKTKAEDLYLYRDSTEERTFSLGLKPLTSDCDTMKLELGPLVDFISLNNISTTMGRTTNMESDVEPLSDDSSNDDDANNENAFFVDTNSEPTLMFSKVGDVNKLHNKIYQQNHSFNRIQGVSHKLSNMNQLNQQKNKTYGISQKNLQNTKSMSKKFKLQECTDEYRLNKPQQQQNKQTKRNSCEEKSKHHTHFKPLNIKTITNSTKRRR